MISTILLAVSVSYGIAEDLPLKHDGYVVEELAAENGERSLVVKAATERAFLYANYESNRWMNAEHYPFVRDPHFKFRALDVSRSPESLKEWIAATGANAVYLKRGRPDARRLRECAELGVPAYGFLYGCDAAKWNREKYDGFVAAHPSARGVTPPKSWEKGTMCPSDPATREFFKNAVREIADVRGVAGVVVCLWDDYGLNCVCDRCRSNGFAGNWGRQVAFAVRAWEDALKSVGKKLIVRTWASGASHWLGDEWVHAPGYGGETGEPLSVWGEAMKTAGKGVLFQTKVYNADCQPDPPFSALLPVAPRKDIAEWQITGQTVGLQYLPASVVDQTARQFRRVAELVSPEGGVMLYAGAYKRDGYAALSDDLNSVNIHVWRQLSWDPRDDVESLWREWAVPRHGANAEAVIAAMKATEHATTAAFSPLGLGAPTESFFANSVVRRESLLRYTNRYFLPEGQSALKPTLVNVARVVAEKDDAIREFDRECGKMADGTIVHKAEIQTRFNWLRAHLEATRALDGALWRYFYLRARGGKEDGSRAETLSEIDADFETVRRLSRDGALCAGLGSPVSLMKDIRSKSASVSTL